MSIISPQDNPWTKRYAFFDKKTGRTEDAEILFINENSSSKPRFSVLVRNYETGGATLHVRGSPDSMRDRVQMLESGKLLRESVSFNLTRGVRSIIYASRHLNALEAEQAFTEYQTLLKSSLVQQERLEALADKLETSLTVDAVIGFKNIVDTEAHNTLQLLKRMGLRSHILSGDNQEHCMTTAYVLKMLNPLSQKQIIFNFDNEKAGAIQIRRALDMINTKLSSKFSSDLSPGHKQADPEHVMTKNLELIISGKTASIIYHNRYLKEHFKFILEYTRLVIGFEMQAFQKAQIVKLFKQMERKTAAVGDGFNDVNMIQAADVGFQRIDPKMGYQYGDIIINYLSCIPQCMLHYGREWNSNLNIAIHNIYKFSLLLFSITALYQVYSSSSGATVLNSYYVCLCHLMTIPISLIYIFINKLYLPIMKEDVPAIYCEKDSITKRMHIRIFFKHILAECALEAIGIIMMSIHTFMEDTGESGKLPNFNTLVLVVFILSFALYTIKNIICSQNRKFALLLYYGLVWIIGIGLSYLLIKIGTLEGLLLLSAQEFVSHPNNFVLLGILSLLFYTVHYFLWNSIFINLYFPLHEKIRDALLSKDHDFLALLDEEKQDKLLLMFKTTDSFVKTYKKCFSSSSEIYSAVKNHLAPSDENKDEDQGLTPFLSFKYSLFFKRYSIYALDRFSTVLWITLCGGSSILGLYLILSAIIDRNTNWNTIWSSLILFILLCLLFWSTFGAHYSRKANVYSIIYQFTLVVTSVFFSWFSKQDYSLLGLTIVSFLSLNYGGDLKFFSFLSILTLVGYSLILIIDVDEIQELYWGFESLTYPVLSLVYLYATTLLSTMLIRYNNEKLIKQDFITGANLEGNIAIAKDLLGLLLPKFILDEMKSPFQITNNKDVIECKQPVTILFCDIADFDSVVQKHENNIITILDQIFRNFDTMCTNHGVQKIETVGKTYMAASGLEKVEDGLKEELRSQNPTLRALNLAKSMMDHITEYENLNLKIGIHVGKPVMGVIGYHKPQFSLIGDVVNTTSRHCTTGSKGSIMLSSEAWQIVKEHFKQPNTSSGEYLEETVRVVKTEMKGKGLVDVYHFSKKRVSTVMIKRVRSIVANRKRITDKTAQDQITTLNYLLLAMQTKHANFGSRLLELVISMRPQEVLSKMYEKICPKLQSPIKDENIEDESPRIDGGDFGEILRHETDTNAEIQSPNILMMDTKNEDDDEPEEQTEKLELDAFMNFTSSQFEIVRKYFKQLQKNNTNVLRVFFSLLSLQYIMVIILHVVFRDLLLGTKSKYRDLSESRRVASIVMYAISLLLCLIMVFFSKKLFTRKGKNLLFLTIYLLPLLTGVNVVIMKGYEMHYYCSGIAIIYLTIYQASLQAGVVSFVHSTLYLVYLLASFCCFFIIEYVRYFDENVDAIEDQPEIPKSSIIGFIVFILLTSFFILLNKYINIQAEISAFNNQHLGAKSTARIAEFVDRLLPKHVRETLESNSKVGETEEDVTLLFADIVGFTAYSSDKTPSAVVELLSELFTRFDQECNKLNLYKVYTIGDCYVVMSFLDKYNRRQPEKECRDVTELAFKMIEIIAAVRKQVKFDGLHMRIGVHTGRVIGGLIGSGIVRYDLYGHDVLIANKMESSGSNDRVHISEATKQMLLRNPDCGYRFIEDQLIPIKVLDTKVKTYFIER